MAKPRYMFQTTLNVTPSEAGELLEVFLDKKEQLIQAHPAIFKKLADYERIIEKLRDLVGKDGLVYPTGGSWNQRIRYVLTINPNGMSIREIADAIAQAEGIKADTQEWKNIYKGVAPSLSMGEKLYDKKEGENGNIYTLKK